MDLGRVFVRLARACEQLPRGIAEAWRARRRALLAEAPRIGVSVASPRSLQGLACEGALIRAGGWPVLFARTRVSGRVGRMLDCVSGLLLSGGADVDPRLYGGDPRGANGHDRRRDEFELQLLREAIARDMPVLAICRGSQILNVAHGGRLRNLLPDRPLSISHGLAAFGASHCDSRGTGILPVGGPQTRNIAFGDPKTRAGSPCHDFYHGLLGWAGWRGHGVQVCEASKLATGLPAVRQHVNSFHRQAVSRLGAGLQVCAMADDGVVEGIEHTGRTFVVGVQWHPEIAALTDPAALQLFRELVRRAAAYRTRICGALEETRSGKAVPRFTSAAVPAATG